MFCSDLISHRTRPNRWRILDSSATMDQLHDVLDYLKCYCSLVRWVVVVQLLLLLPPPVAEPSTDPISGYSRQTTKVAMDRRGAGRIKSWSVATAST